MGKLSMMEGHSNEGSKMAGEAERGSGRMPQKSDSKESDARVEARRRDSTALATGVRGMGRERYSFWPSGP